MAKVSYSTGIDYVSGAMAKPKKGVEGHKCGTYLIGTHRVAETTSPDCNRIYLRKKVERTTPPSPDELEARQRFKIVSQAVAARAKDLSKITADKAAFLAQKDLPGGKKTLKSWYWMVELQAYDENQG